MKAGAVRIGVNPITWSNDDLPALGGDTPLEQCLAEAREAGFDGIELGNKFPRDAARLAPLLARHGLALVSGWWSSRLAERSAADEIAALEPHLALLEAMGCDVLVLGETSGAVHGDQASGLSRRPVLAEADWPRYAEELGRVAEHTRARGVRLAVHHHMGTVIQTEAEIDRLMAATGSAVWLLLDTGHLTYAGGDVARVARRHAARIAHLHAKDVRAARLAAAVAADRPFLDAVVDGVFTVPGDGAVEFEPVLEALAAAGYAGWLVVEAEQDPAKAPPRLYARMGHDHLEAAAARAGLRRERG